MENNRNMEILVTKNGFIFKPIPYGIGPGNMIEYAESYVFETAEKMAKFIESFYTPVTRGEAKNGN